MKKQTFDDDKLLQLTETLLDDTVEHLDMKTTMALERARQSALDASSSSAVLVSGNSLLLENNWFKIVPALTLALLLLGLSVFFINQNNSDVLNNFSEPMYSDIEILGASESLEFYNDLDFYQWLELDES